MFVRNSELISVKQELMDLFVRVKGSSTRFIFKQVILFVKFELFIADFNQIRISIHLAGLKVQWFRILLLSSDENDCTIQTSIFIFFLISSCEIGHACVQGCSQRGLVPPMK